MSSVRSVVDQDHRMVMYRPEWRTIAGSLTAAILLSRIHYWWNKSGNRRFYKFVQIPESPNAIGYKDGDSWLEETGMSLNEYHGAMKKIGRRLKKDEIDDHETALGDDYLVGYYITQKHQTYFYLNDRLLNEKLEQLYGQTDEDRENDCYPNPHLNFPNGKIPNGKSKDRHIGISDSATSEIQTRYITKQQQSNNKANPTTTTARAGDDFSACIAILNQRGLYLDSFTSQMVQECYDDINPKGDETKLDWFRYACEESAGNKPNWKYFEAIIRGVDDSGSLSAHRAKRQQTKARPDKGKSAAVYIPPTVQQLVKQNSEGSQAKGLF